MIQYHPADSPLRAGIVSRTGFTANHFARESAMDAMAA